MECQHPDRALTRIFLTKRAFKSNDLKALFNFSRVSWTNFEPANARFKDIKGDCKPHWGINLKMIDRLIYMTKCH